MNRQLPCFRSGNVGTPEGTGKKVGGRASSGPWQCPAWVLGGGKVPPRTLPIHGTHSELPPSTHRELLPWPLILDLGVWARYTKANLPNGFLAGERHWEALVRPRLIGITPKLTSN